MSKKNGMKFALISTASLLSTMAPAVDVDESQTETADLHRDREPAEVFSLWDSELSQTGDVDELLKGYDSTQEMVHEPSGIQDSVAIADQQPLAADTFSRTEENPPEEEGSFYSVGNEDEAEIDSYYRFLGELMYMDGEEKD